MNTDRTIEALRLYLGAEATANSLNGLLLQAAHKRLASTSRRHISDAGLAALNDYLTVDRVALQDAMYAAAIQYLNGDDDEGSAIEAAIEKYILTGGTPPGPTYAQYQAHIATLALQGAAAPTDQMSVAGRYRVTLGASYTGGMFGSTWQGDFIFTVSTFSRGIQHALPDTTVANAQAAGGREVYVQLAAGAGAAAVGKTRNGYASASDVGAADGRMIDLIYWDGTQAQRVNPFAGTGPTLYTF